MIFQNNSKLVMMGDSVTDVNRERPIGEGLGEALGKGYPSLVSAMINTKYPESRVRVVNMGISGNNVRDLKSRWQTDVFDLQPDWVSVMIGINDVWRHFDAPYMTELHVPLDEYKKTLDALVETTLPKVSGMILMTPYYIEPNKADTMRAMMDGYGQAVKEIAQKHNTVFVDVQAAFDRHLEHYNANALAWDRVHPNLTGHMIIANEMLKAIGY